MRHRAFILAGMALLALMPRSGLGQEVVLDQNFDGLEEGFIGRAGLVLGERKYTVDGRWADFGSGPGSPVIQSQTSRGGNAVEFSRIEGQTSHSLNGSFNGIQNASRILFRFEIFIPGDGGAVVALSRGNDMAAGVLLRSSQPGIRGWNAQAKAWETVAEFRPPSEWCEVLIDCNVAGETYRLTVRDEAGREVAAGDMPLDSSLLSEAGIGNVIINPQLASPFYIDNVTVQVEL